MPLQSKKTLKVHEIPTGTTKQQYLDFVEHLCKKPKKHSKFDLGRVAKYFKGKSKLPVDARNSASTEEVEEDAKSKHETGLTTTASSSRGEGDQVVPLLDSSQPTARRLRKTTFCFQNGQLVGTISFENEALKREVLAQHEKNVKSFWKVEDNFDGITILYEGPNAKLDICAVHGQGGNAMDTWTADNGQMWLRDFLPEHQKFKDSRIMTFGYDSDVTDRSTVMELENWAESLLRSLDEARTGDEAMTHLNPTINLRNIKLSQFGIIFLATPHSGSTIADWNNFLVATAHAVGGVRTQSVEKLRSFNPASVWDTAAFLNLEPCPPFQCFAEGLMMRVKGMNQHIVTQSSATLGKKQAYQIMNVDHVTICKFDSRLGPFMTISMALLELLGEVTRDGMQQPEAQRERRMFGQPRFQAHAYPPDRGFWWEGNELNTTQREQRNVFFLGSQDGETIDVVLSKLSTKIGFDMIEAPGENQERWRSTPVSERIEIFITWLGDTCNKESLFIIDDIEAFGYSKIPVILKYPAQHALISTRDSNLKRADRVFRELRLSPLGHDDTVRILENTLENLSADPVFSDDLGSIARVVQGHPLAARNAIPFAMEYLDTYKSPSAAFLQLFETQDPEERRVFFEFNFEGRSLWEAFNTSLERLELQQNPQNATGLLEILPFLSCDNDRVDDFLKMKKSLSADTEEQLPDMAVLKSSYTVISNWLSKLRGVSFYLQSGSSNHSKILDIHPLMLQYMLLRLDERRRVDLIRQVLQLCHALVDIQNERQAQIRPHVLRCVQVCRGLGILLNSVGLPEDTIKWVESLHEIQVEEVEDPFSDPMDLSRAAVDEFVKICMEMKDSPRQDGTSLLEENTMTQMLMNCVRAWRALRYSIEEQGELADYLKPTLLEAMDVFQEMVRLRNMYPDIILELGSFRANLVGG
ncbi:AAA ATPase domain-containing protein [Fusarium globosum]|uniref:AAA ATPase domain-containing protein n=1 Tax=Fusarium globosum TaxID=78864 RepID=A0A8H5XUS9_9HYPO|nr:AAA ATPase domain-containing protein [Fusarium globosum]